MMQTTKSKNKITFNSTDNYGEYEVRIITTQYLQLQMHTSDGEVYANTGRKELTAIRDMINTVLEETKQ